MYQYRCPGDWYGTYKGLRNIYTQDKLTDTQAIELAKNDLINILNYHYI